MSSLNYIAAHLIAQGVTLPPAGGAPGKANGIINPAISQSVGQMATQAESAVKFAAFFAIIIRLGLIIGAILCLLYLLMGGVKWITSEGDKAGVESARNTITHAVIGLIAMAIIIAVLSFVGSFLQINLLNLTIPTASDIP